MALKIDIRPGEEIIAGDVRIKLVKKSGQLASLVIDVPKDVTIKGPHHREDGQKPVLAIALP